MCNDVMYIVYFNDMYIGIPTQTQFRRENILIVVRGIGEGKRKNCMYRMYNGCVYYNVPCSMYFI